VAIAAEPDRKRATIAKEAEKSKFRLVGGVVIFAVVIIREDGPLDLEKLDQLSGFFRS
jgi:hypothetical protein